MLNTEGEVIAHALNMWVNYIETGDCITSAQTAKDQDRHEMVNALTEGHMRTILMLKEIAKKHLKNNKQPI